MSRRTPIKELIEEDAGTPSSPIRRSSRIAVRRSSAADDLQDGDHLSTTSTSSIKSRTPARSRMGSKSPITLSNDDLKSIPGKRTRSKGSTSSLIEDEIASFTRSSPIPGRVTRRSIARSMSCSPVSEVTNKISKTSTPQKEITASKLKRGRGTSSSDPIPILESIKEVETTKTPTKEPVVVLATIAEREKSKTPTKDPVVVLETVPEREKSKTPTKDPVVLETVPEREKSKTPTKDPVVVLDTIAERGKSKTPTKDPVVVLDTIAEKGKLKTPTKGSVVILDSTKTGEITKTPLKEPVVVLNSINKTVADTPPDETKDEDLPFKKKKAVLLQTITEKSVTEDLAPLMKTGDINSTSADEISVADSKTIDTESKTSKKKRLSSKTDEEKELIGVLNMNDGSSDKQGHTSGKSSADISLNLHISDSEDSDTKAQTLNMSSGSNTSEKENSEKPKTKILPEIVGDKGSVESIVLKPKNSINQNSFSEPMDVDITLDVENQSPFKRSTRKSLNIADSTSLNEKSITEQQDDVIALNKSNGSEIKSNSKTTTGKSTLSNCADEPLNAEAALSTVEKVTPSVAKQNSSHKKSLSSSIEKNENVKRQEEIVLETQTTLVTSPKICIDEETKSEDIISSPSTNKKETISNTGKSSDRTTLNNSFEQADRINLSGTISGNVIVATDTTPVRRSPRIQRHSENQSSPDTTINKSLNCSKNCESNENLSSKSDPTSLQNTESQSSSDNTSKDKVNSSTSIMDNEGQNNDNTSKDKVNSSPVLVKDTEMQSNGNKSKDKISSSDSLDKSTPDSSKKENNQLNITNFNSSADLELSTTLKEKITALTERLEVDSSSDAESVTHFIVDEAEEGEEDTPSEGSNDIIDLGESIGSTASEIDSDESYEADSFIDDDEECELLSGEEYDLGQEKPSKKFKTKRKRVLEIQDSSDEEVKESENAGTKTTDAVILNEIEENGRSKDDSDMEKMSTQPYCGLTPPSIISIRDSPSESEDKRLNHKDEEIVSSLINKEDNLESLEQIKEHERISNSFETAPKVEITSPEQPVVDNKIEPLPTLHTPNNSVLASDTSQTQVKQRKRLSSMNIQENISIMDISDGSISDRIMKVVEVFCSNVTKSGNTSTGNISLNLSLDYEATSPRRDDKESITRKRSISESFVDSHDRKKRSSIESQEQISFREISTSLSSNKRKSKEAESPTKKRKMNKNVSKILTDDDENLHSEVFSPTEKKGKKQKQKGISKMTNDQFLGQSKLDTELSPKNKQSKKKSPKTPVCDNVSVEIINTEKEKLSQKRSPKVTKQKEQHTELNKKTKPKPKLKKATPEVPYEIIKDMSDDLDEELREKYSSDSSSSSDEESAADLLKHSVKERKDYKTSNKNKNVNKSKSTLSDTKKGKTKTKEINDEEKVPSSSDQNWQIQYLPPDVKKALLRTELKKTIGKHESKIVINKSRRTPKLLPSSNNTNSEWESYPLDTSVKPSKKSKGKKNTEFHVKDYKNQMTFDTKRIKRMETKELLKRKEKIKS